MLETYKAEKKKKKEKKKLACYPMQPRAFVLNKLSRRFRDHLDVVVNLHWRRRRQKQDSVIIQ